MAQVVLSSQAVIEFLNSLNHSALTVEQIRLGVVYSYEIEYQKFNPRLMRAILFAKEPNMDRFQEDMIKFIVFVLTRGTNYEKAKLNLATGPKAVMEELIRKYNVKIDPKVETGSRGTNAQRVRLQDKDVTLGRISACWPQWSAQILAQAPQGSPLQKWFNYAPGVPAWLCFPQSASIVPSDDNMNLNFARTFYNEFDKVVNRNAVRDDRYIQFRDQFFITIKDSDLFSQSERRELMARLPQLQTVRTIVPTSQTLNEAVTKILADAQNILPEVPQPMFAPPELERKYQGAGGRPQQQQQRQQQQQLQGLPRSSPAQGQRNQQRRRNSNPQNPLEIPQMERFASGGNQFNLHQEQPEAENPDNNGLRMTYDEFAQLYRDNNAPLPQTVRVNIQNAQIGDGYYSASVLADEFPALQIPNDMLGGGFQVQGNRIEYHLAR